MCASGQAHSVGGTERFRIGHDQPLHPNYPWWPALSRTRGARSGAGVLARAGALAARKGSLGESSPFFALDQRSKSTQRIKSACGIVAVPAALRKEILNGHFGNGAQTARAGAGYRTPLVIFQLRGCPV